MISHEWNNLLHGKIEKIILTVLRSDNLKYKENVKKLFIKIIKNSSKKVI